MKTLMAAVMAATTLSVAAPASAEPIGQGCVSDFWMYGLRGSTRIICDSDRFADGSWERRRGFFAPRRYVPMTCNWSSYGGSCYGGYWLDELNVIDSYPVTDATVLPDEPGYIESAEPRVVA